MTHRLFTNSSGHVCGDDCACRSGINGERMAHVLAVLAADPDAREAVERFRERVQDGDPRAIADLENIRSPEFRTLVTDRTGNWLADAAPHRLHVNSRRGGDGDAGDDAAALAELRALVAEMRPLRGDGPHIVTADPLARSMAAGVGLRHLERKARAGETKAQHVRGALSLTAHLQQRFAAREAVRARQEPTAQPTRDEAAAGMASHGVAASFRKGAAA